MNITSKTLSQGTEIDLSNSQHPTHPNRTLSRNIHNTGYVIKNYNTGEVDQHSADLEWISNYANSKYDTDIKVIS